MPWLPKTVTKFQITVHTLAHRPKSYGSYTRTFPEELWYLDNPFTIGCESCPGHRSNPNAEENSSGDQATSPAGDQVVR